MQANELRIGNYVQIEGVKNPIKVSIIDTTESSTFTKAKPIPLTEEWLLKFGANEVEDEIWCNKHSEFELISYFYFNEFFIHLDESRNFYTNKDFGVDLKIKYVHQLQNLYFALTGKELEIL